MPKNKTAHWILVALLLLAFGSAGFLKLSANPMEVEMFARFGYPLWFMYVIGVAEITGALGLVCGQFIDARLPRFASLGLLAIMIGAITSHLMHDPLPMMLPAVILSMLLSGFLYVSRPVVV